MKKILEIGDCCAGIPQGYADLLETEHAVMREEGIPNRYGYEAERTVYLGTTIAAAKQLYDVASGYDVLHFHCRTLSQTLVDVLLWKLRGKEVWLHFHGSDIRLRRVLPYYAGLADRIFVSTPDLLQYTSGRGEWLPAYVPDANTGQIRHDHNPVPVITHLPTNATLKGTVIVEEAIKRLVQDPEYKDRFVYRRVEGVSHADALAAIASSDIILDQVNPAIGFYGTVSLEAMAAAVATVSTVSKKYDRFVGHSPVFKLRHGTVTELAELIGLLIDSPQIRRFGAGSGPSYVRSMYGKDRILSILEGGS